MRRLKRNAVRICRSPTIGAILGLNVAIALGGIISVFVYYEPGNPNRWLCCRNPLVETLGIIGYFIGLFQILYLFPLLCYAALARKWRFLGEIVEAIAITAISNGVFLLIVLKMANQ